MAKKSKKQTKQENNKAEEPVVDNTENEVDEAPADDNVSEDKPAKKATKRGAATKDKNESPAKKKKVGKVEENGDASTRPKRATATKAEKEVKTLLSPKRKIHKKSEKKTPKPRKEPSQFEVESILDSRKRKGRTEFKIRWKGYTSSSDTWEPARNLNCPELLEAWKADKEKTKDSK